MQYQIRSFDGVCPKTGRNTVIDVLYQHTYTLKRGKCLEKFKSECKCDIDCPIFNQAPNYLSPNG